MVSSLHGHCSPSPPKLHALHSLRLSSSHNVPLTRDNTIVPITLAPCSTLVLFSLGALLVPKSIYDLPKHRDEKLVGDEDGDDGACGGFASISEASATAEPAAVKSAEGPSSVASSEAPSARTSMSSTSVERLTQALLPMAMRNTIGEPRYSFVAVPEAPPQPISAERRERSDKWIRRLSSTPMPVPSELSDQSMVEGQTPGSQASSPGGGAPRASHVRASHYRPSMTVLDDDGSAAGGRPRVVSAIDLFRPSVQGGDTDRMSMQSNSSAVSTGSSATKKAAPFKPKLETVAQSSANLSESIAAAEAEDAAKPPAKGQSSETLTANGEAPPRKRSALMQLLTNGVYMCTVMAVSCLFFVVTGIQFWVTKYIVEVIGMDQTYVTPAFGGTSIIAPLLGVFAGGAFIDKIGGYKGASAMASTLKCCAVFAACAAIAAIACAIVPKAIAQGGDGDNGNVVGGFASCIGLIAVTLIFGGAVIPAATGVIVSSVPWELRNLGSAFSMLIFQQFGYALAPIVSAGVAESVQVSSEDEAALTAQWQLGGFNTSGALRSIGQISLAEQLEGGNTTAAVYLQIDAIPLEAVIEGTRRRLSIETCFLVVMLWGLFGVCFMTLAAVFASCHKAEAEKEESMRSEKVSSRSSAGPAGAPQLGSLEATSASSAQAQL